MKILKEPPILESAFFSFVYIPNEKVSYLVDSIETKKNKYFRFLASDNKNEEVIWFDSEDVSWWPMIKTSDKLEVKIPKDSLELFDLDTFRIHFNQIKFTRLTLPLVSKFLSFIPTVYTNGFVDANYPGTESNHTNKINCSYYQLKNIKKSRWIYVSTYNTEGSFELAASNIFGLKGATWHLSTKNRTERHSGLLNYSLIRKLKYYSHDDYEILEFTLGLRSKIKIKLKYQKNNMGVLWEDEENQEHQIKTTLKGEITIEFLNPKNDIGSLKWINGLIEINGKIFKDQ